MHRAQRKEVRPGAVVRRALQQLGREEARTSNKVRQKPPVLRYICAQPEVAKLDDAGVRRPVPSLRVTADQYVLGLDVAMGDVHIMAVAQRQHQNPRGTLHDGLRAAARVVVDERV